jgi:cytochrome b pre-mRNA-processing protein 3
MLRSLSSFFSGNDHRDEAHRLYLAIVEQSRKPVFYTDHGVPDTVDGRFDMITVHMFLVTGRLKKEGTHDALELLRTLSEVFFADMDRSLREMGSSDTGVGKRIKKMSQAFYGRLLAYQTAGKDHAKMQDALLRNLYRGDMEKLSHAHTMDAYISKQRAALCTQPVSAILQGEIRFS